MKKDRVNIILVSVTGLALAFIFVKLFLNRPAGLDLSELEQLQQQELIDKKPRKDFQAQPLADAEIETIKPRLIHKSSDPVKSEAQRMQVLSENEKASISVLVDTFLAAHSSDSNPAKLIADLKKLGLVTQDSLDQNPDTGAMMIVRTDNSLPGTRYFQAQYFGDDGTNLEVQSISFEVRPGPDSEERVTEAIQRTFGGVGEPTSKRDGFKEWRLKNCKTVWVKRMTEKDLKNDPINPHKLPQDVGTLKVAQQDDPHCHELAEN